MKRVLSFLLALAVVFCTLSSVTATVYAGYEANLVAHQKLDNILQNYVDPDYHLDNYSFTESEEKELRAVAAEAIKGCTTEYEKISAVTRFVAENIYYDYDYYEDRTSTTDTAPYAVWTSKKTVCAGYTRLTKALLNFLNIPCMYVTGDNHAFNIAYDSQNDRWIYLDTTWASSNTYRYGEYYVGSYRGARFDMSLEMLSSLSNHEIYSLSGIVVDGLTYVIYTPCYADTWTNENEWYGFVEGVSGNFNESVVNIVSSVEGVPVTRVSYGAFEGCTSIKTVKIPDSITELGQSTFMGCTSLTSVEIGDGVTILDYGVFSQCTNLKSVKIGNSITSIDSFVFSGCKNLTSIIIPDNVTSIGYAAFNGCTGLESVRMGNSLTSIGNSAFNNCTSLKSITIPDSLKSLGNSAFYNCTNLKSITIPDNVTSIGYAAFDGCTGLESVRMGNSVTSIGDSAFNNCTSLTSITIPDGVTSINDWVFAYCEKLTYVILPDTIERIGYASLYGTGIKNIFYKGSSTKWSNIYIDEFNYVIDRANIHYNATGHTESGWITDVQPTCSKDGSKHTECTVCGEQISIKTLSATGHNYSTKWTVDKKATCTENGSKSHHCLNCGRKKDATVIPATGHISSEWIIDKVATVYSGGKRHIECEKCGITIKNKTITQLKCSKPNLKAVENTQYGVKITWSNVKGGDKYRVYRKTRKGEWKYLTSTTNTYFTDKTAKSGTKYYYAVKARNEAGNSSLSSSLSKYYLADTTLNTPSSTSKGIGLKWTKVTGAQGYMVYRKTGSSGSYTKITTEKGVSNLTYRDTTARKGKKYYYKVKAYYSKTYSAYSNTKSVTDKY